MSQKDDWKLKPPKDDEVMIETFTSEKPLEELKNIIESEGKNFTDENFHWIEKGVLSKNDFINEKVARENLLNLFSNYAKVCEKYLSDANENYFLLLNEILKRIRNELNLAINEVLSLEIEGKRLWKGKGESMEHYLMRYIILKHFNEKYGIKDLREEYSKLKEVLESFKKGMADKNEWKKVAKRADIRIILKDGTKLWVEIERSRDTALLSESLQRLKRMLDIYPDLFDKVVYVFPLGVGGVYVLTEHILIETRKIRFPRRKLEFFGIDLRGGNITQLLSPKLVKLEFGDRGLDWIADGGNPPKKKSAKDYRDKTKEKIIIPLVNGEWDEKFVKSKIEKIRRLIAFWRRYTRKDISTQRDMKFKENALKKIKQNYPFLLR